MQWLIDLIVEKVLAIIGIPPVFIDRGDPRSTDWSELDFTIDNAWHDLDLSSIVPAGAKGVLFTLRIASTHMGSYFYLRKNGNLWDAVSTFNTIQVADVWNGYDLVVACDENRIIEYRGASVHFSLLTLTVKGWWL